MTEWHPHVMKRIDLWSAIGCYRRVVTAVTANRSTVA